MPTEGFCFHNELTADFSQTSWLFEEAGIASRVREPHIDFRDACRAVTGYKGIITARFHAAVVAGTVGIPAIAIANGAYYSAKMRIACEDVPSSVAIDITQTSPKDCLDLFLGSIPHLS